MKKQLDETQVFEGQKGDWKKVVQLAEGNCKLRKAQDFAEGLLFGEFLGLTAVLGQIWTETSLNLPTGTEFALGTAAGVALGYLNYRKNKAKQEYRRDRVVNHAKEQMELQNAR